MMGSVLLYRPVGLTELELIAAAKFVAFPPRMPEQPIFYPVLNFDYAEQIARDWNTKTNSFASNSAWAYWSSSDSDIGFCPGRKKSARAENRRSCPVTPPEAVSVMIGDQPKLS